MAKLIAVIGNVGVGKTTLAQRLSEQPGYLLAQEDHAGRAFHNAFALGNHTLALANQIDYLLVRAEQEASIRSSELVGVVDGGLEQDLFVFTRYFVHTGMLTSAEYALCQRLYGFVRHTLPRPDLFIHLHAPVAVLLERYTRRRRSVEVISGSNIPLLESFVHDWLAAFTDVPTITVDVSAEDPTFATTLAALREPFERIIGLWGMPRPYSSRHRPTTVALRLWRRRQRGTVHPASPPLLLRYGTPSSGGTIKETLSPQL